MQSRQSNFYYPRDLVTRSSLPKSTVVSLVRGIVQRVALQQPISNVKHWSKIVSDVTAARSVQVRVLGAFALMAFLPTFGSVVLLCGVVTPVGSLIPVLRAVRVNPATVLWAV